MYSGGGNPLIFVTNATVQCHPSYHPSYHEWQQPPTVPISQDVSNAVPVPFAGRLSGSITTSPVSCSAKFSP
jgi:hypothetical protein